MPEATHYAQALADELRLTRDPQIREALQAVHDRAAMLARATLPTSGAYQVVISETAMAALHAYRLAESQVQLARVTNDGHAEREALSARRRAEAEVARTLAHDLAPEIEVYARQVDEMQGKVR